MASIFPNEIYMELLHYVDYITLKRCMRVSRSLKAITELRTFDALLFRRGSLCHVDYDDQSQCPDGSLPALELHPAFKHIRYKTQSTVETVVHICGGPASMSNFEEQYILSAGHVGDEFAVMAPLKKLTIMIDALSPCQYGHLIRELDHGLGITVNDVLKALIDLTTYKWGIEHHNRSKIYTGTLSARLFRSSPKVIGDDRAYEIHFAKDRNYDSMREIYGIMRGMRKKRKGV